jgi:hypothetical protein
VQALDMPASGDRIWRAIQAARTGITGGIDATA